MNSAPPGFIPLDDDRIVNVHAITGVSQEKVQERDPNWDAAFQSARAAHLEKKSAHPEAHFVFDWPSWYPVERWSGKYRVLVVAGDFRGMRSNCSLSQFTAKMIEAMEESNG